MLTKKAINEALPAQENGELKSRKLADQNGLYLYVSPQGTKSFRFDYRFAGKRFTVTFGLWPAVSLDEARKKHLAARTKLADGINPSHQKQIEKLERVDSNRNTFEHVGKTWYESKAKRRSKVWQDAHSLYLKRDLNPELGGLPIATISAQALLSVLEAVEARSGVKTAERVRHTAVQVFDFGMRKLKVHSNVARSLTGWADIPPAEHRAWLKADELPAFLDALEAYEGYPSTVYAIKLLLLTFVRKRELIGAQWEEFDFDNAIWVVPATRMKLPTEEKTNRHRAHDVPLSRQAIKLLKELRPWCAGSDYLFPSISTIDKPLAASTLNVAFKRMGYAKLLTPHGVRGTVSTILNEKGYDGHLIDRQLAHVERNASRAAYNHARYLEERRELMQAWADLLDEIRDRIPESEEEE
ncbi:MAG: tyrosine-type recombinase/integrase [Rhodocyclales bacterium]|nr:tyrosine-type recombinase/integrase [Rhodocyclales bacterium]